MKRLVSLLLLACLLAAIVALPALAQDKAAKIDELMSLYQEFRAFNGSVLVAEGGRVVFKKGYGLANMEWNIPNQPDTRFRVGSITKQFTSALILQLVEEGKIKIDARISDYLPDYPKKVADKVTIHHLLNHTSGIPSYTGMAEVMRGEGRNPFTPAEFVKRFIQDKDLEFEPGSRFAYNNSGYFLLGYIIEKVTGQPYEQRLKQKILEPLGMVGTGYDLHRPLIMKRAAGYDKLPGGYANAPYLDMTIPYAAGSMYSTVEDLYTWDQALYAGKVVSAKSMDLMYTPGKSDYGYGWVIRKIADGKPGAGKTLIGHGGGIFGFNTLIEREPETKNLIVLFNNAGGAPLGQISENIRRVLYGQPYERPKKPVGDLFFETLGKQGLTTAAEQFREWRKKPEEYNVSPGDLNSVGYALMQEKKYKEAIEVFKLNVEAFPKLANAYDSLGEAYMESGDKENAIRNYGKSLELNPRNVNAIEKLKKLADMK